MRIFRLFRIQAGLWLLAWLVATPALADVPAWESPLLRDHPLVGKIIDLNNKEHLSPDELYAQLRDIDLLLVGEKHDNPDHHQLEQRLMKAYLPSGKASQRAVVFEMLDDAQADRVAQLRADNSLTEMKTLLQWPERGWVWESYGPLFKLALEMDAQLIAGNVNRDTLQAVYASGPSVLPLPRFQSITSALNEQQQSEVLDQIFESHCEMMPRESLAPMVQMQLAKDASMAQALVSAEAEHTMLIAGGFHVGKQVGVPKHLRVLAPDRSVKVVMLLEVSADAHSLDDYPDLDASLADYVWFTPQASDKDYCASLRKQHGK